MENADIQAYAPPARRFTQLRGRAVPSGARLYLRPAPRFCEGLLLKRSIQPESQAAAQLRAKKRIFIVDDHDVVRFGATQLIAKQPDLECCGGAASVSEALPLIRRLNPDLIVADLSLKNSNGLELIKVIRAESPQTPLVVMSMHDELVWAEVALRAGAQGYIMKESSIDQLIPAIRTVLDGKLYLSPPAAERMIQGQITSGSTASKPPLSRLSDRELQVLNMVGQWKNSREIAAELSLSIKTIEYYKQNLKEKLSLKTGAELTQFAVEIAQNNN
jgi:DNA-binding NarL/FixJ family response regulator